MPVTYRFEGTLLLLTLEGEHEREEIVQQFQAALADPKAPETIALLIDVTASQSLETRTVDDVRYVSELLGRYVQRIGGRCAVVAARDIHFGMSRMGAVFSRGVGVEVEVFRDMPSALRWLGVGPTGAPPTPQTTKR